MIRVLMLSRDTQGLDPQSGTASRWRLLRDAGAELEVIIASSQTGAWEEPGLRVVGTGGASPVARLWRLWKRAQPLSVGVDCVTAQDPFELGWIAWRIARRVAKRFEIQDHGGFFDGKPADEPLWWVRSRVARWLSKRAHSIRTVSMKSEEGLRAKDTREKTYFLPITPRETFAHVVRAPEQDLVVTVSRLVSVKRVDALLRAFVELRHHQPRVRLVIVGDGPLRGELETLRDALGLGDSVEFVGAQDPVPWLARASVFVSLSSHEGWGVASVEAAMAGVPVVMTDTGCAQWLSKISKGVVLPGIAPGQVALELEKVLSGNSTFNPKPLDAVYTPQQAADEQVRRWHEMLHKKERVLICAQAMDEHDPLFGFFVPWVRAFSERANAIVCALRVSDPAPAIHSGVEVIPLRPRASRSRVAVVVELLRASWVERHRYTSVFVRGDAQYLVIAGWLWRLLGKRVVFWYTHYTVRSPWFWLGVPWAHEVVTAARASNPLRRALLLGHHVDTDVFVPGQRTHAAHPLRVLVFGRVSEVKRVDWIARVLMDLHVQGRIRLRIVGRATTESARVRLHEIVGDTGCWEERDVTQAEALALYQTSDVLVNATDGSLDKVLLEAGASGCIPLACTSAYAVADYAWLRFSSADELHASVARLVESSPSEREVIAQTVRAWVVRAHAQAQHIDGLIGLLCERRPHIPRKQCLRTYWLRWFVRAPAGTPVFMFHAMDGRGTVGWDMDRLRALVLRLRSHEQLAPVFTFDDGTRDTIPAIEWLATRGVRPAVFIPSQAASISTQDGLSRSVFTRDELMHVAELACIGGHGSSHERLTRLPHERAVQEIQASATFAATFQQPHEPLVFAYPGGAYTAALRDAVRQAGFERAYTVVPGVCTLHSDPWLLPRVPVLWWMSSREALIWIKRT